MRLLFVHILHIFLRKSLYFSFYVSIIDTPIFINYNIKQVITLYYKYN